jgi:hypothetical protein
LDTGENYQDHFRLMTPEMKQRRDHLILIALHLIHFATDYPVALQFFTHKPNDLKEKHEALAGLR